jgi:hypothetical protein
MRLALLLTVTLLAGCADAPRSQQAPAPTHYTAGGVPVVAPSWASKADLFAEALAEIDSAGVPSGWTVRIEVPVFATAASETGLARGLCDYEACLIVVGWRAPGEVRPVLPALGHEILHAVTGDPEAGH